MWVRIPEEPFSSSILSSPLKRKEKPLKPQEPPEGVAVQVTISLLAVAGLGSATKETDGGVEHLVAETVLELDERWESATATI